jgi:phospholipid transport system transporter-binding protein
MAKTYLFENDQVACYLVDHIFWLSGHVDYHTVAIIYNASQSYLTQNHELTFDFSLIKTSDSSGLALMIEWLKYAKKAMKPIHFQHIPAQLKTLAKTAGISALILN